MFVQPEYNQSMDPLMGPPPSKNRSFAVEEDVPAEDNQQKTLHKIEWWSDQASDHQTQVARIKDLSVSAQWSVCVKVCVSSH